MAKKTDLRQTLIELSELDGQIAVLMNRKKEIVSKREVYLNDIGAYRGRIDTLEAALKEGTQQQVLEEHRLHDEQDKVVARQKELSSIGGAKGAKLIEREMNAAGQTLQAMEERAIRAIEQVDKIEEELGSLKNSLESLETTFEDENQEFESSLTEIESELGGFNGSRSKIVDKIEDRLLRLYNRVSTRYPGDAIALADKGSCRSCFRSLPLQTYNQVLVGNMLIQCPGCGRIIVASPALETN